MKLLRKFVVFVLGFVLVNLFGALVLSFAIREIFQNSIITGTIKEAVVPIISENIDMNDSSRKQLEDLLENPEVNEQINNVVNEIINTLGSENGEFSPEIFDNLFDYIIDNKEDIETITGTKIDVNQIEEFRDSEEFNHFKEATVSSLNETNMNMDDNTKTAIKTYSYVVSNDFRIFLVILIVIDILLIALVQWSLYNWLIVLGRSVITSGVTILVFSLLANTLISTLKSELDVNLSIDVTNLMVISVVSIIFGIIFIITNKVIANLITINKKEEVTENEVSSIS